MSKDYTQGIPNLNHDNSPVTEHDDELPIALRKQVRSYTQHLICKFVSLEKLSPTYRVFVSMLDQVQIPST